jgi:dATP pyrophosphohydrolase
MPKIQSKYVECYIYSIENGNIKFLLLKRSSDNEVHPGIWQIVTGRIEENEKAFETALRELKEETGLKVKRFFVLPKVTEFYTYQNDSVNIIPLFLAEVEYKDAVISDEHSESGWFEINEAINKIHWLSQKENLREINSSLEKINPEKTYIEINTQ